MNVEPFVPPKELAEKLTAMGVPGFVSVKAEGKCVEKCRILARAMAAAGYASVIGLNVRASDAYSFIQANPTWRPWSGQKKKQKP